MSYTASASIARIKAKGFVSTATALTDPDLLAWLDDVLRSGIVPFLKSVRDEWFVSGLDEVEPDANGRITMPSSVASTIRTIEWLNNGQPTPLTRIEPEQAYLYEGQSGSGNPCGFVLRGYGIQILPTNVGSVSIRLRFMERPAEMVLEENAAEAPDVNILHTNILTLADVPLAWQEETPSSVDIISAYSPFSTVASSVGVTSLVGDVLTLDEAWTPFLSPTNGLPTVWVSDPGTSPFPNVPIEFHPLLQRMTMTEIYSNTGDSRAENSMKLQTALENSLRKTMAPRTQGNARPLINMTAPGMGMGGRGRGWGW